MPMIETGGSEVSERIKSEREARGWSQAELARKAKLGHPSVVSNAERGLAGESVRQRIAKALGIEAGELA